MSVDNASGHEFLDNFELDSAHFAENFDDVSQYLIEKCPVAWTDKSDGYWVASRYEDVREVAQDYETFTNEQGFEPSRRTRSDGDAQLYPVEIDPPYQTRWRAALGPYFSPRAIRTRTDAIREQANLLIDTFIEKGQCEFIEEFAAQLPGRVFFGAFLGVPLSDLPGMQQAAYDAVRGPMEGRVAGWNAMSEYLKDYLLKRESEPPRDDFIDAILRGVATDEGAPCPWEHKLYTLTDLAAGGLATTTYLLAGMAQHLATHPQDFARLAAEPELRPKAVEEFVRYYASILAMGRTATRDTEIAGQSIAKGDMVMLAFAVAARDPQVYEDPNRVDIERDIPRNVAFGFGPHRCIGSHIARLQGLTVLEEMLRRLPGMRLAEGQTSNYSHSSVTRDMDRLDLVFTPGPREG